MQNRSLLSTASLDRIEQAVAAAEKSTSCEFIVVLAPASSRYEGRALRTGTAVAVLVFVALYWINELWLYGAPDALLLLLEAAAAGLLTALAFSRVAVLRRSILPRWRMQAAVQDAANAVFTDENVSLTKDRNAVLLYVSVLEGEARLMPDIGAQNRLHAATVGEIAAALGNAKSGDPTELVCDAIRKLGQGCVECFPVQADDLNELPDRPQIRMP
ncbi:MAG: hypothetical protein IT464_10500 [Planctomycetes bacterium]|nr:hypothetical protein [Planctomycetota bacterium]